MCHHLAGLSGSGVIPYHIPVELISTRRDGAVRIRRENAAGLSFFLPGARLMEAGAGWNAAVVLPIL
jgi:hypothetical protein